MVEKPDKSRNTRGHRCYRLGATVYFANIYAWGLIIHKPLILRVGLSICVRPNIVCGWSWGFLGSPGESVDLRYALPQMR